MSAFCTQSTTSIFTFVFVLFFLFQSYRDLKEVTPEALQMVKRNFEWVAERVEVCICGVFMFGFGLVSWFSPLMNNVSRILLTVFPFHAPTPFSSVAASENKEPR